MTATPTSLVHRPPLMGAAVATVVAVLATLGHLVDLEALHQVVAGLPTMTVGTATFVLVLAAAVVRRPDRVRTALAATAGAAAGGLLVAWALAPDAVPDDWLPSPPTALLALGTAVAVLLDPPAARVATGCATVVATAAGLLFLVRIFELPGLDASAGALPVGTSVPTGAAVFALNLGWALRRTPVDDPIVRVLIPGLVATGVVTTAVATLLPTFGVPLVWDAAVTTTTVLAGAMATGTAVSRRALRTSDSLRRVQEALVSETSYGMILVTGDGTVHSANPAAAQLFGLTVDELEGMSVDDLVPLGDRARHAADRAAYLEQPRPRAMAERRELQIRRRDGEVRHVRISLTPLPQPDGPPLIAAGIVDVTELTAKARDAERRARSLTATLEREVAATDRLRQLDEAKDLLLSAVSHEIRTPLTVLIGFADMLNMPDRVDPAMREELLGRLQSQAHRLGALVDDLLDLARFQRGDVAVAPEPVRLDRIARQAAESASHAYARHVVVDVPPVLVLADPGQVARVLDNLLSNACKYAPTGHIHVDGTVPNPAGRVQLSVEDEGDGIPEEVRERIFDPFERGLRVDDAKPGLGIGLALVRRLVQANAGSVWVEEGARAGGARFVVDLPSPDPAGAESISGSGTARPTAG